MATQNPKKDKNLLTSLNHALKIMDLLSIRSNLGVTEISRVTGYDKASVYKMLYTMQHRGYVVKNEKAQYALSGKLSANGGQMQVRQNVVDVATPHIRLLRDACGETVLLGMLNTNGKIIFTYREEGTASDSIRIRSAYEIDAYTNAGGKIILSRLEPPMLRSILGNIEIYPHTTLTVRDERTLLSQLEELREADFSEQYDENYYGHSDIAAPIYDETGRCIAALSIACPTETLLEKRDSFLSLLLKSAESISREMGWTEN